MARETFDSLSHLVASVNESWLEARSVWKDAVASRFERECWEPFDQTTREVLDAARHLESLLASAESDLGAT